MVHDTVRFVTSRRLGRATVVAFLALTLPSAAAEAKTLYVDGARGDDSHTYETNSEARPWRTIGRAAWGSRHRSSPSPTEAARAGDIVVVAAGTYTTVGLDNRWEVAYNPVNSGRLGAPIRFEGRGLVSLVLSSGRGPVIGARSRDHVEWSGFTISESTAPSRGDTGPVVFFEAQGGVLEHSSLTGTRASSQRSGDNYPGVRIHASRGQRIADNVIRDFGIETGDENHAGVQTYWAADITIENNEISGCGSAIYLKGNNEAEPVSGYFRVIRNLIHDNKEGIRILLIPSSAAAPNLIAQNVFYRNVWATILQAFNGGPMDARHAKLVNNTFADNSAAIEIRGSPKVEQAGHIFQNNLVAGGEVAILYQRYQGESGPIDRTKFAAEHNVYFELARAVFNDGDRRSLAEWRRDYRQDSKAPAASAANPKFVDASKSNYRLNDGSPALTQGRAVNGVGGPDGAVIPAGAYITGKETIGPRPPHAKVP